MQGHNRDGKEGSPLSRSSRFVFGLLCAADGCPVAIEVFEGNTADHPSPAEGTFAKAGPATPGEQIDKIKAKFKVDRVVFADGQGMPCHAEASQGLMTSERMRAHVFLSMLACYVVWHMQKKLAPMLFEDAGKKAPKRRTPDELPVHSFRTLLQDLATLTRNTVRLGDSPRVTMLAEATPVQAKAFALLGLPPEI